MNAKEHIKKGEIRPSDVPYEQREGGLYTNKDVNVGYVPTGMSVHEWHEFQRAEVSIVWVFSSYLIDTLTYLISSSSPSLQKRKQQAKNFAAYGPTSFKSRSLQGKLIILICTEL